MGILPMNPSGIGFQPMYPIHHGLEAHATCPILSIAAVAGR
jgi:hypothetical protein